MFADRKGPLFMSEERKYHFETLQLHVGQEQADPATDARAVPIYQTTSFVFHNAQHAADRFALKDAGNVYGRLTNPTEDVFSKRIAALEGGVAAVAVASGAAAVTYTLEALVHHGQHIVAATTIYGGTYNLFEHTFPNYGIETTFVDPTKGVEVFEEAIKENTRAVYIESVGNPNANLIDIQAVADIAHKHKIPLVVDSTFATPYQLRPFEYGADIVVHSATKFIGGRRCPRRWRQVRLDRFGQVPAVRRPEPELPWHQLCQGCRRSGLCYVRPHADPAR